jgi:uncharacterized protein YpuA (DUF1002 family)
MRSLNQKKDFITETQLKEKKLRKMFQDLWEDNSSQESMGDEINVDITMKEVAQFYAQEEKELLENLLELSKSGSDITSLIKIQLYSEKYLEKL